MSDCRVQCEIRTKTRLYLCVYVSDGCLMQRMRITHIIEMLHVVFPQESWRRFTHEGNPPVTLDRFWISDSIPHAYMISQHKPFEVISISDAIVSSLLSYDLLGDTQ